VFWAFVAGLILVRYGGHASAIAATTDLTGVDAIVIIGGDGTIHDVINGLLARKDDQIVPIGILPGGSGNSLLTDFKAVANLTGNVDEAINVILDGYAPSVDVARVEFTKRGEPQVVFAMNTVGYSADQCMSAINIDGWRQCLGSFRYEACAFWGILKGRSTAMQVVADEVVVAAAASSVFVNCTQYFGKGLRAAPRAY
jgi:sphingosine kinase